MGLVALADRITGQAFGLSNYNNLKDDIDWLIDGEPIRDKHTANVSTTGTSFSAGADLLTTPLTFTADGTSDYLVKVSAQAWENTTSSAIARLNLDGADGGIMGTNETKVNVPMSLEAVIVAPSAGDHTVNVRVEAHSSGSTVVSGGAGGPGNSVPIVVSVQRIG